MPHESYDRKQLQDLKAAAKELHELSRGVGRAIDSAAETGELQRAKDAFAELEARTKEYDKLREKLGPAGIFLAKFNVEVRGPHEVSFVLPKGVSRIEMLPPFFGTLYFQNKQNRTGARRVPLRRRVGTCRRYWFEMNRVPGRWAWTPESGGLQMKCIAIGTSAAGAPAQEVYSQKSDLVGG